MKIRIRDDVGEWEMVSEHSTATVWALVDPGQTWLDKRAADLEKSKGTVPK